MYKVWYALTKIVYHIWYLFTEQLCIKFGTHLQNNLCIINDTDFTEILKYHFDTHIRNNNALCLVLIYTTVMYHVCK